MGKDFIIIKVPGFTLAFKNKGVGSKGDPRTSKCIEIGKKNKYWIVTVEPPVLAWLSSKNFWTNTFWYQILSNIWSYGWPSPQLSVGYGHFNPYIHWSEGMKS